MSSKHEKRIDWFCSVIGVLLITILFAWLWRLL